MSSREALVFLPDVYPSFCSGSELWWKRTGGKVVLIDGQVAWHCSGGRQLRGEPLFTLPRFNPCVKQSVQAPFLRGGFRPCQLWNHIRCALVIGDLFNIHIVATRKI